jgi:hypothetical protein
MPEARTYSYDEMHAALCIFEEMVSPNLADAGNPWEDFRRQHGVNALRDLVINDLATPCNEAWDRAYKRYEAADEAWVTERAKEQAIEKWRFWEKNNPRPTEPGSFDYEFVPVWIRECVDWSLSQPQPRYMPS